MQKIILCVLFLCCKAIPCKACELSNMTIVLEKTECGVCISVNATWCSGYCFTKDPSLKHPLVPKAQNICTYKEIIYETVKIQGCADNVDPFVTYPVATDCHCAQCDMDTTDCTVRGLGPTYCSANQENEQILQSPE
ncbi:follitropin subunit beta isoform X2 [Bombina bombina]|nr:follitropin subunit beta isoform X2 [Bombina bombina]XP_053544884.1 follitropin subunit beta isoform X2 [Bombina bombina]